MTSKPTLLRYIAIDRYMNIRAKTSHTTNAPHSFKGHQRHPSAMIFRRCLAIYSESHIFTSCCNITPIPHNIAKPDFCQSRAPFNHAIRCNESRPIRCDTLRSGDAMSQPASQPMTSERSTPRFRQDIIKLH